jgi:acetyltransferase-like isoleucine patch superfamily enzyme
MTLLKWIKEAWIHQSYQRRFHQAVFASGARLLGATVVSGAVRFGQRALVQDSRVGSDCIVGDGTCLHRTSLGFGCWIGSECRLIDTAVGDGSYLSEGGRFDGCVFGKYCSVGPQVLAGFGEHPTDLVSTHPAFYATVAEHPQGLSAHSHFCGRKTIHVGNDVWIGARAFLRDGVTIGDGAVIGAGAVVVKDVAPYVIVGGVPARPLRQRFPADTIEALLRIRWWDWPREEVKQHRELLGSADLSGFVRRFAARANARPA